MEKQIDLPELSYEKHKNEKFTLHLILQIIGKIRLRLTPRKNHWWYVTEYVDPTGITTGPISYNQGTETFSITLNVHQHQLEVLTSKGEFKSFDLVQGLSIADFYIQVMSILSDLSIKVSIYDRPYDLSIDQPFKEITTYHHYDKFFIQKLWRILLWVDGVFKEFSGRFYGKTCPVHLYWHSMDLAVTRFSGEKAPPMPAEAKISNKDAYSHECISFGFWVGDDNIPEPAFYFYTYPSPKGIEAKPLYPSHAEWIDSNGSPMAILRYNKLIKEKNPRKELLNFLEASYQAGASLAGWDLEKFQVPSLKEL